jgi:lysyl-tRNA synthetase class 1
VPAAAAELDVDLRRFLARFAERARAETPVGGDAWQALLFTVAGEEGLPGRKAFESIYRAFLGRANGPRAGWLLASLDPVFVVERAWAASGWTAAGGAPGPLPVGG